jgi:hypothetical protein
MDLSLTQHNSLTWMTHTCGYFSFFLINYKIKKILIGSFWEMPTCIALYILH